MYAYTFFENSITVLREFADFPEHQQCDGHSTTCFVRVNLFDVEGTDQSDYLLMKYCSKCMTLYIQHMPYDKTRFGIPLLSLVLSSQRKFDDRIVFLCHMYCFITFLHAACSSALCHDCQTSPNLNHFCVKSNYFSRQSQLPWPWTMFVRHGARPNCPANVKKC